MYVLGSGASVRDVRLTSGLPQQQTFPGPGRQFSFGPKADTCHSTAPSNVASTGFSRVKLSRSISSKRWGVSGLDVSTALVEGQDLDLLPHALLF